MALAIDERFTVRAPPERVWAYLTDPRAVAGCVPGAELTGVEADGSLAGRVTVKLGPVTVAYTGRARFEERDADARRVRLVAEAREAAGGGTVGMEMESALEPLPDGGTEVHVHANVELTGRVVQFGRGLIESVSHQVIHQFVACVREAVEPGDGAESAEPAAPGESAEPAPPRTSPVRALPLLARALLGRVARLFRRRGPDR